MSMPFSDPRAALVGRTSTSSIRPRYSIAWSFSPGLMPSASRILGGIQSNDQRMRMSLVFMDFQR